MTMRRYVSAPWTSGAMAIVNQRMARGSVIGGSHASTAMYHG